MSEAKKGNKYKDVVYREELPCIIRETRQEAPGGGVIAQERIQVHGPTLGECKRVYDKVKEVKA